MLDALYAYLVSLGYTHVNIDFKPDESEYIALICWDKIAASMYDGTANHLVQVRVCRPNSAQAERQCLEIAELLDSGDNERLIPLPDHGPVIGRIRRLPVLMERTENSVTYYAELALWGRT